MIDKQQLAAMGEHMREMEECKTEFKVSDGWKLVPVEMTRSMLDAVNRLDDAMYAGGDHYGASIEQCWECLLAAAPEYKP